jgi:hypothetical protein
MYIQNQTVSLLVYGPVFQQNLIKWILVELTDETTRASGSGSSLPLSSSSGFHTQVLPNTDSSGERG